MAGNTSKSKIEVVLAPHQSLAGTVSDTWPRPSGVKVRFKNDADKPGGYRAETRTGDLSVDLKRGVSYEVEIESGDEWNKWWVPAEKTFTVPSTGKPPVLTLVPRADRWLVWLRLVHEPTNDPVPGATVSVAGEDFRADADGYVAAAAAAGEVKLGFGHGATAHGEQVGPSFESLRHPVPRKADAEAFEILYRSSIRITIEPVVTLPDDQQVPLVGAEVTAKYHGRNGTGPRRKTLRAPHKDVRFEFPFPGVYEVSVEPPATINGWPVRPGTRDLGARSVTSDHPWNEPVEFETYPQKVVSVFILTPGGLRLDQDLGLEFSDLQGTAVRHTAGRGGASGSIAVPDNGRDLTISLAPRARPTIDGIPLTIAAPAPVLPGGTGNPGTPGTTVTLEYEHAVTGDVIDEAGNPVPDAVIDVFDTRQDKVRTGVADENGHFIVGIAGPGDYFVAAHTTSGGTPVSRSSVRVNSIAALDHSLKVRTGLSGSTPQRFPREAVTDLSSYPVLTEEVSTGGGFPVPGSPGSGGGGYGASVEQVMRDVLGWRPSKDVAGFQAALAGAFELREVPGHTEVTWQQRGYSVQADMGALTGAQASIYARAKNALDQVKPLLAGLTSLDPSVSTDEEREAVRAVVTAELTELVSELSLEGGPRAQRVDELFTLLTGQDSRNGDVNLDPDRVGGQLRVLRERFALTDDNVDTIDNERVQTSFRIIVEQVLALQAGWAFDRGLLVISQGSSLGTLLISLSRGLEAVGDSIDEVSFALDSVFIDAAQRQVVELRFAGITVKLPDLPLSRGTATLFTFPSDEPPMLLSDLLDWVGRATRDEGPRLIQDTGRDGVAAFAPVLDQLRRLVRATRVIADHRKDGLRTSRVHRALDVLTNQLDEAADFAELVRPPADEQNSD